MTRYNNDTWANGLAEDAYREGVDRVVYFLKKQGAGTQVIDSIRDAIEEGIV